MNRYFQCFAAIVFVAVLAGCQSFSKHPIDAKPSVMIDRGLLGIWKAVEDTDRSFYIVVQDYDDMFGANAIYAKDADYRERKNFNYYITIRDKREEGESDAQMTSYLSKVNGATFLNLPTGNDLEAASRDEEGYCFVRLLSMNEGRNIITATIVTDPDLQYLGSPREVRQSVAANLNRKSFYSDTMHFYKVSSYHASLVGARAIANPGKK